MTAPYAHDAHLTSTTRGRRTYAFPNGETAIVTEIDGRYDVEHRDQRGRHVTDQGVSLNLVDVVLAEVMDLPGVVAE